jgi:hypothetical protein
LQQSKGKHNRSLKVAVQGLVLWPTPYTYITLHPPRDMCCSQNNPALECTPRMSSRHFWSDPEMRPVEPTITGITFTSTSHKRCTPFGGSLYFVNYSTSIFSKFSSGGVGTSFSKHVTFLSRSTRSDFLYSMVLSGIICWFHNRMI